MSTILVTGASGQLGALVIKHLAARGASDQVIALVRNDDQKAAFAAQGISTRHGDYEDADSLRAALQGVDKLLLISSSAIGQRARQHGNVIAAAKDAGVGFIAYTSILNAQESPLALAAEHKATEDAIKASGIPYSFLRNGWYSENITMTLPQDLELGQHFGAAGEGQFSTATRNDYAEAAAVVLTTPGHDNTVYELGGDQAYTLADYAATLSTASGKSVAYVDMPEDAFKGALIGAGLPEGFADLLANSDANAAKGGLFDGSKTLSNLIGRPTEPIDQTINAALAA